MLLVVVPELDLSVGDQQHGDRDIKQSRRPPGPQPVIRPQDPTTITAAHITAVNVWAQDQDGLAYWVEGTETYSDAKDLLIIKLQILSARGRLVDSLNIVLKNYDTGGHGFSFGTCNAP